MNRFRRILLLSAAMISLPCASKADPGRERDRGLEVRSRSNLKRLALALHNFAEKQETLPAAATTASQNKPLLSWRVHVLPFLGEQALYDQFRLFESWDSEHNSKLIPSMPDVFKVPLENPLDVGKTTYLVPVGATTMFPPPESDRKPVSLVADVYDGLPNTIMLVEADRKLAREWTRPDDLDYDPHDPLSGLGTLRRGGFLAVWGSGQVSLIPVNLGQGRADRTKLLDSLFGRSDARGVPFLLQFE